MFTGIIEETGTLQVKTQGTVSAQLVIGARKVMEDLRVGDSVAVNGVCLTATVVKDGGFTADVMAETLAKTNLGDVKIGAKVNLERALRFGERLGGHLVTGHIDGVGRILRREREGIAWVFTIHAPPAVARYLINKGSVAVDGISLTIVEARGEDFTVSIIPHTAAVTTLGFKGPGDTVNLEADLIGKYVAQFLQARNSEGGVDVSLLSEHGFI